MGAFFDPISQAILAAAPIECPSCGDFIDQFIHPAQDCGVVPFFDKWEDLRERLVKAEVELRLMADESCNAHGEAYRLDAKAEGVALAIDYMRGYGR